MYKIQKMNKIAQVGIDTLDPKLFACTDDADDPDAILVRSASLHEYEIKSSLKAIARAGAGTNNIPIPRCTEKGVVVFNTPGANSNAVKELVIAGMLTAFRNLTGAVEWVKDNLADKGDEIGKLVEKGKSAFAGREIQGKKLGVIGLGAIGVQVSNAAVSLGMEVYGYDPFLTVDGALRLNRHIIRVTDVDDIFKHCDVITIHVPYNPDTKATINAQRLALAHDGIVVLNFARGELVVDDAMAAALESGKVAAYVTDFPNEKVLKMKNVIAFPHLGASTSEAEDTCAVMACKELQDYLTCGNIVNSVNFPSVVCERSTGIRLCAAHKNVPGVLESITGCLSREGINIDHMVSKFRGDIAYSVVDLSVKTLSREITDKIAAIENMIRLNVIE